MNGNLFIRGLLLGLSIAAPVGPIGVLCIRRTLVNGQVAGLVSGLGAATADAIYGAIAGFGLMAITGPLIEYQTWLRFFGGAFLCYLGIKTLISQPAEMDSEVQNPNQLGAYASTFMLTLTNPMTILSFAAIFTSAGVGSTNGDYGTAITLIAGVFVGSALWWLLLSTSVGVFRQKINPRSYIWINRVSGTVITLFGLSTLFSAVF